MFDWSEIFKLPAELHKRLFSHYVKFLPGVLAHLFVQALPLPTIQKFCMHLALSGLVISAAVRSVDTSSELSQDYLSRQAGHLILTVRLGLYLGAVIFVGLGVASLLQRWHSPAVDDSIYLFTAGAILTGVIVIWLLSRCWLYLLIAFLFSDVPYYKGGNWILGLERIKQMLAEKERGRLATAQATIALIASVTCYLGLLSLDISSLRTALLVIHGLYIWPILAMVLAIAGVRLRGK